MDPHTTSKKPRSCIECHQRPETLGLGSGGLVPHLSRWTPEMAETSWDFVPAAGKTDTDTGSVRLAPFVRIDGTSTVKTSRKWLRTFNSGEIRRILDAGICVGCHNRYDDPVIKSWEPGKMPGACRMGKALFTASHAVPSGSGNSTGH